MNKKGTFEKIGEGKATLYAFRSTPDNDVLIKLMKKENPNKTTTEIINELLAIAENKKQNN